MDEPGPCAMEAGDSADAVAGLLDAAAAAGLFEVGWLNGFKVSGSVGRAAGTAFEAPKNVVRVAASARDWKCMLMDL